MIVFLNEFFVFRIIAWLNVIFSAWVCAFCSANDFPLPPSIGMTVCPWVLQKKIRRPCRIASRFRSHLSTVKLKETNHQRFCNISNDLVDNTLLSHQKRANAPRMMTQCLDGLARTHAYCKSLFQRNFGVTFIKHRQGHMHGNNTRLGTNGPCGFTGGNKNVLPVKFLQTKQTWRCGAWSSSTLHSFMPIPTLALPD